jgi:hypothetical protein
VATIVVQRQPDGSTKNWFFYVEDARYAGNLLGGPISGESQTDLLARYTAMHADPLLRLTVDLYSEALADPSHDARYLRFWSVLETLSGARIAGNRPVVRIDGTPWPQGRNTTQAAPRVYQYLADWLGVRAVDEHNLAGPANDLYEAVRGWYARRNATGHYGPSIGARPCGPARTPPPPAVE